MWRTWREKAYAYEFAVLPFKKNARKDTKEIQIELCYTVVC